MVNLCRIAKSIGLELEVTEEKEGENKPLNENWLKNEE